MYLSHIIRTPIVAVYNLLSITNLIIIIGIY